MEKVSIQIRMPSSRFAERQYIVDVIFSEVLGLQYDLHFWDQEYTSIFSSGIEKNLKEIKMADVFLSLSTEVWLKRESLDWLNISFIDVRSLGLEYATCFENLPVFFGQNTIIETDQEFQCGFDVFGACFFLLTRYEELLVDRLDRHDRFPLEASVLSKHGLFKRPIVNEYCNFLKTLITVVQPKTSFKTRRFKKKISCDVDFPVDVAGASLTRTVKRIAARLFRDRSVKLACNDFLNYLFRLGDSYRFDFCVNNLFYISRINKEFGNDVAFNLLPLVTNEAYDMAIDFASENTSALISKILHDGHTIGFHPGYDSYDDEWCFVQSYKVLQGQMDAYGYTVDSGRNHYLRYNIGVTPQFWEHIGAYSDSSLGFAEAPGFRASVCNAYTMFDLVAGKTLKLKQQPLVIMDVSLQDSFNRKRYFDSLSVLDVYEYFEGIVAFYGGELSILWHNDNLVDRRLYERIVC